MRPERVSTATCRRNPRAASSLSRVITGWVARAAVHDHAAPGRRAGPKPLSIVITAGQRGDSPQFETVLEKVRVPRTGPGGSRVRPDRIRADKAYASRKDRAYRRRRGIRGTIPDKADQARNRWKLGSHGGRPPHFDPSTTASVRRSSAGSTVSRGTVPSPHDMTSSRSATR
ncbi:MULTISPECIES: transposase [Streptomyces]|uniref:transposase n=1 Tax=Streptomyces sp. S5 TaxID=1456735 RepID=UPI001F0A009B|nr:MULTISPECIES: transposase [Streptomyces]